MKILDEDDIKWLDDLISLEVDFINHCFETSEDFGKSAILNTMISFKEMYLKNKYGNILPQFSSEYRYLIVGILKNIDTEYQASAVRHILLN